MMADTIHYLLFDIESIADPLLIKSVRHPGEDISPEEALKLYRKELMEKKNSDFIPYAFQVPISLALAKIRPDFSLAGIHVLKCEEGGPEGITRKFWEGWRYYNKPTFVTFNGFSFDIPLMELAALRYGIPVPEWFSGTGSYSPRNRYSQTKHLDLYAFFSNFGAAPITGGLNVLSKMIRRPGKLDTHGDMVLDMFYAGKLDEVHSYCRCDVLDTYFLFLRSQLLSGKISPEQEKELVDETRRYLENETAEHPIYKTYLEAWDNTREAPGIDTYLSGILTRQQKESDC